MTVNPDNILIRKLSESDISALDVLYVRYAPQVKVLPFEGDFGDGSGGHRGYMPEHIHKVV